MPDPLSHAPDMITIRPRTMPRFWWLCPWAYARVLHTSANAVKAYADRLDDILDIQRSIIEDQSKEISRLKDQVNYWQVEAKTDNARWLRTLEENDALRKRIADLDDAIIAGKAITPDAEPHE